MRDTFVMPQCQWDSFCFWYQPAIRLNILITDENDSFPVTIFSNVMSRKTLEPSLRYIGSLWKVEQRYFKRYRFKIFLTKNRDRKHSLPL
jgi:hypothetical protein